MGGFPDVVRCVPSLALPRHLAIAQNLPDPLTRTLAPTALHYPYVLAFEPTFIEVRHVESGSLMQIIPGNNIKCLFADSPPSASASSAAAYHQSNTLAARYGSPYGRPSPAPPPALAPAGSRNGIIVADGDRAFSLCFNAPVGGDL